jgi:zinc D-Ala-D-Ala carboxypeptidase
VASHRADPSPSARSRVRRRERSNRRTPHRPQFSSLSVSQIGIVSALGIATIAAPLTGLVSGPVAKEVANEIATAPVAAPAFPFLHTVQTAVGDLRVVTDDSIAPSIPSDLAPPRDLLVTRPARGQERAVLPGCFGQTPMIKAANGQVPNSSLCTLWDGKHQLRADAAVAAAKLNVAYTQQFGHPMCVSDGYRTLAQQYTVKAERGGFAARPGSSVHGLGRALDLCDGVQVGGSTEHQWMVDNAARYGWTNPPWALAGGGGPYEPWHWEYLRGQDEASTDNGE